MPVRKSNIHNSVVVMPSPMPAFLRIHKNACSGISNALQNGEPRGKNYPKAWWWENHHGTRELLCLFRDPFKRTESGYQYMRMGDRLDGYAQKANMPNPKLPFEEFVMRLCDPATPVDDRDPHFVSQFAMSHYWYQREPHFLPTVSVPWNFSYLSAQYERPIPKKNVSERLDLVWTPAMRDAHLKAYAWDHEYWRTLCNDWHG